jgi:hypothetical protein
MESALMSNRSNKLPLQYMIFRSHAAHLGQGRMAGKVTQRRMTVEVLERYKLTQEEKR